METNKDEKNQLVEGFFAKLNQEKKGLVTGKTTVKHTVEAVKQTIEFMVDELNNIPINIRRFYLSVLAQDEDIFNKIIDAELFLKIIRHLRIVGERKREKHSIGANIIVYTDHSAVQRSVRSATPFCDNENELLPLEIKLDFFENSLLESAYKHVNPQKSYFAYYYNKKEHTYKFMGIRDFKTDLHIMPDLYSLMKSACAGNTIGFSVEGGTSCIRIYYRSSHFLDYALSEASGSWEVKFTQKIKNLVNHIGLKENEQNLLVEQIMNLSYMGVGSMIIITDTSKKFDNSETGLTMNLTFVEACDALQFKDYASLDGAVIIEKSNGVATIKKMGVILSPKASLSEEYYKLINGTSCGARHEKAARYACEKGNEQDYIIVVSENRTVSLLHGRNPIYWRDRDINE